MSWRRFPRWRHWIPATILAAKSKVKNIVTNVRKTQICKSNINIYKRLPTKFRKYIDLTKELQKYLNNWLVVYGAPFVGRGGLVVVVC